MAGLLVKYMKIKLNFIIIPLITVIVSVSGSWATDAGMGWYDTLNLPSVTPPGYVIGIIWSIIFILTTISALVVWNKPQKGFLGFKKKRDDKFWWIIGIFIANAFLNFFWSVF